MRLTAIPTTVKPAPDWIGNVDESVIIGEDWRAQQAEILAMPRFVKQPPPIVEEIFSDLDDRSNGAKYIPKLSEEQGDALSKHLANDPVAWCNYFVWYQERDPPRRWMRGRLTPGQLVLVWSFAVRWKLGMPVRDILLKARRQGFSLIVSGLMAWIHFFHENRGGMQAAHEKGVAEVLLRYLRGMWERMPTAIQPAKRYSSKKELRLEEPDEKKRAIHDFGLQSYVLVTTIGSAFAGSGVDVQAAHLDEVGKWDKICDCDTQFDSITNTIPEVAHTWVSLTSTAHGAKTWFHGFWRSALRTGLGGWNGFRALFIPWFFDPRNSAPCPKEDGVILVEWSIDEDGEWGDEIGLMERFGLDVDQMWWRRIFIQKQKARGGDLSTRVAIFKQEYPSTHLEAWIYADGRFILPKLINELYQRTKDVPRPVFVGRIYPRRDRGPKLPRQQFLKHEEGGPLTVYRWPAPGSKYMIAADVSTGEAVDSSCIKVHRWTPKKIWLAAEWYGLCTPSDVANFMWRLGHWYNLAFLNWERTGPGMSIAAHLVRGPPNAPNAIYPIAMLYRRRDPNTLHFRPNSVFGVDTSGKTKRPMLDMWLQAAMQDNIELTQQDVSEAGDLVVNDRGQIGTHGADRFMATVMQVQAFFTHHPEWQNDYDVKHQPGPGSVAHADGLVTQGLKDRESSGTGEEIL